MKIKAKWPGEGAPNLVFSCSGAADTAEISDRAARAIHKTGEGKMYCLAGIGGNVETIVNTTRDAGQILVIDGCDVECAKKLLERNGFTDLIHLRVIDQGWEKGKTPPTEERIEQIASIGRARLAAGSRTGTRPL